MTERRYSETEVAEIFQRATETQQGARAPLASRDGMTLDALQQIGREVGLPPELIAQAARSLDRQGTSGTTRFLGLPIGVRHTVELGRRLTDAEWEALVVDLRQTFDARGRLRDDGAFRQWTNGNLQALLEPSGPGHRLRLRTSNGSMRAWMLGGLAVLGVAAVSAISALSSDIAPSDVMSRIVSLGVLGVGMFAAGALRVPAWARLRMSQMREIAARLTDAVERRP